MSIGNVSEIIKPVTVARILGMMARTHNEIQVLFNWLTLKLKNLQNFLNKLFFHEKNILMNESCLENKDSQISNVSWNCDIFVQAVQELVSRKWMKIISWIYNLFVIFLEWGFNTFLERRSKRTRSSRVFY